MKIYSVTSTNMDVRDGDFKHGYFMHKRHAEKILKNYAQQFQGNDEVLDLEGKLEEYNSLSLKYTPWHNKPANYYMSHYGNYRMVLWIEEIWVQE